ncbi:MAG TPA: DUF5996 family protein [Vicinamibacterales bacterium]|nr:DUF5996 family protein [Vicinamibacterales bacterium]
MSTDEIWPPLPLADWQETYRTLHLWLQIAGKIRMACTPHVNHWWEVPLYVSARGLTTSPIPHGHRSFELTFDFIDHLLLIQVSDGQTARLPLGPRSVAAFYAELMARLRRLGLDVTIRTTPVEIDSTIPFEANDHDASYDAAAVERCWRILLQVDRIFKQFRSRFIGKNSPVHFFWGAFDLAVTRFSGRRAPERDWPQLPRVMADAYSHEVISAGFWPGGGEIDGPIFYSYAVPEPAGFRDARLRPDAARYHPGLGEFILRYDEVRTAASPDVLILEFLQTTYEAGARLAGWNRGELERAPGTGA